MAGSVEAWVGEWIARGLPSPPQRWAIFVARHGEREDYTWRTRGENWQAYQKEVEKQGR